MMRWRWELDDSESGVGSSAGALSENALVLPLPTKPEEAKVTYTGVPVATPAPHPKSKPEGLSKEQRLPLEKKLAEAMAAVSAASSSTSPTPKPPPRELLERTAKETAAVKATDQGLESSSQRHRIIGSSINPLDDSELVLLRDGVNAAGCTREWSFMIPSRYLCESWRKQYRLVSRNASRGRRAARKHYRE